MKRLMVTVALALIAVPAFAAIEYEFVQKNTTDDSVKPVTDLTGRAVIDGTRSRVDFVAGNAYPPGTYVVSPDGTRLLFVDPGNQWYTEFDAAHTATALGAAGIRIENFKSEVKKLDDRQNVAGIDADHYRLTMSYDISVTMRNLPLKQHVQTEIDSYTTTRFAAATDTFSRGVRTGNAMIDQLIDAETSKVPGFALRQTVTTRTKTDNAPRKSELKVPATRTMVREMWVTKVREVPPNGAIFVVPASYRRADQPEQKSASQLTFDSRGN